MILVTGGMGFIGLHTARHLAEAGHEVLITRYRQIRRPSFLSEPLDGGQVKVAAMDVADPYSVFEVAAHHGIDSVIHLAVPPITGTSIGQELQVNLDGLRNVLEATRIHGARRVTIASSVTVYAGTGGQWHEDAGLPVESTSPTGAFKKAEEILALHYGERTGMDVTCVRIGIVYGPLYHSMRNLPSRLVHAAAGHSVDLDPQVLPFADDVADVIYVDDCAAGLVAVHTAADRAHRVYNLGGGRATSNGEIAAAVEKAVPGWTSPLPAGDTRSSGPGGFMDLSRIASLGFSPRFSIDEGIADYSRWVAEHGQ